MGDQDGIAECDGSRDRPPSQCISCFSRRSCQGVRHYEGAFVSIDVLLTWGTNRFRLTTVRHEATEAGVPATHCESSLPMR